MLDSREIDLAIAELEYKESSYGNYAKLASLYTIRDQIRRRSESDSAPSEQRNGRYTAYIPAAYERGYAAAAAPDDNVSVVENAGTERDFSRAVAGKDQAQAWRVVGELMDTLHIVNPRLYESVLRKMQNL